MTPITKETLEAAGWRKEGDHYYHTRQHHRVRFYGEGEAYVVKTYEVTSIEQIAEVCRLPSVPSVP